MPLPSDPASFSAEQHHVDSSADIRLLLTRKRPKVPTEAPPVLLVHGSTLPGTLIFDLPLDGYSWMDALAANGRDVWTVDFRGYGGSTVPPVVVQQDGSEAPVARTTDALVDLAAAMSAIRSLTGSASVDLVGWSWGASVSGEYAAGGATDIGKLVLYAPQWVRDTPSLLVNEATLSKAYREVDPVAFIDRWFRGLPEEVRGEVQSRHWPERLVEALEQTARDANPGASRIKVPNGSVRDIADHWIAGVPRYDPGAIAVPTLVIVGTNDMDTPLRQGEAIARQIVRAPCELRTVAGGTHFAMIEPARDELFAAVLAFLAEPVEPAKGDTAA
ncbi:alpha/beta fold hydrolase [Sphingomonas aracearum]|uniref:alpha/beta fold hydrolase n=1 Tax=Sphingomonas aracearum TaxID=2283317 RepID=UPI0015F00BCB|nr:alpha/beta hydrolase [Sphingomonas aracearum]